MEELKSLGLRIEEKDQQLKIVSETTERGSRELASKVRRLLEDLNKVQLHLAKTTDLLEQLDRQDARAKNVNTAAIVARILSKQR